VTAPVVLAALLFWGAVFTVYFTMQGTTLLEFLFGRYEALPPDLGAWRELETNSETGLIREERLLLPNGEPSSGWLLHQVRYRELATRAIVLVEPERRVRRRRESAR
jgi:hypothetical protein